MGRPVKLGVGVGVGVALVVVGALTGAYASPRDRSAPQGPSFVRFEAHLTKVEEGPLIHMTRAEYDAYVARMTKRFPDSTMSTADRSASEVSPLTRAWPPASGSPQP